jgi:2-oxoglutarate/2-oxoacid ferredoxin oxidoreductase subunit beta
MTYIPKPKVHHPALQKNAVGLTRRDYEGAITTLCAGCGHDSVTASLVQAFWELSVLPHRVAKMSGIGCSSKTPAYFLRDAHGFNGVHGRMPTLATGANAANSDLMFIGISGDGDSLSIGLGHLSHAIRRNVNLTYILENNGVYGLTKGQFSAAADKGSTSKKGEANTMEPIDGALLALTLGATFVARSFSGDKAQLVPIMKAALSHKGFAFVDVISPCALRDLQRSRGIHQELRLHPRTQRGDRVGGLRDAGGSDHRQLRIRHHAPGDDARRQLGDAAQGGGGLRPHRP